MRHADRGKVGREEWGGEKEVGGRLENERRRLAGGWQEVGERCKTRGVRSERSMVCVDIAILIHVALLPGPASE